MIAANLYHRTMQKRRNRDAVCRFCGDQFKAADVKASTCSNCAAPRPCQCGCGRVVRTPGRAYASGHHPNTQSPESHRKQALSIRGNANPAKRSGPAISRGIRNNHPSRKYPEQWVEHAKMMRSRQRPKTSRLEDDVAVHLSGFTRWYSIGPYRVDFCDPSQKLVVEIHGCWHHACVACFPDGPRYEMQRQSVRIDRAKRVYLANRGWRLVEFWGHELQTGVVELLRKAGL